jgi:hypothetical protein
MRNKLEGAKGGEGNRGPRSGYTSGEIFAIAYD